MERRVDETIMTQIIDKQPLTGKLIWYCLGLMLIGGVLRFWGISSRDFWFDESCTYIYVHHLFDWPADSNLLVESTNLPYYFLLKGWVALFGYSEAGFRSFSSLAAILTIPVLGFVARKLRGDRAAIVCMAFVALNPLHIYYAHEARAYALWMLLLSVTLLFLIRACQSNRWKWWLLTGVSLLGCMHLHYFTLYWIPASGVCVLLADHHARVFRRWFITMALVGICFIPYFLTAVLPAARGGGGAWIADSFESAGELVVAIPKTLWAFLPAGGYPMHLRGLSILSPDTVANQSQIIIAIARALPAVLMIVMFVWVVRFKLLGVKGNCNTAQALDKSGFNLACGSGFNSTRGSGINLQVVFGGLTLIPLLLALMYSLIVKPNYLVGRYDLVAWPVSMIWFSLIVCDAINYVRQKRRVFVAVLICVPLLLCSAVPIERMVFAHPPQSLHHLRADKLATLTDDGDLVIAFSYDRDYLLYYLHRANFEGQIVSFPSWLDLQVGWLDTEADAAPNRSDEIEQDAYDRVQLIQQVIQNGGQVWLLGDSMDPQSTGPRSKINETLINKLRLAGYKIDLIDEIMLIYVLP